MMHTKKGFTLVELLAVIVILAIILAIAVPGISGIITSSKRGAFESDAKMLVTALGYQQLQASVGTADFTVADDTTLTTANITALGGDPNNYTIVRIVALSPLKICVETTANSRFGNYRAKATSTTVTDFATACTSETN